MFTVPQVAEFLNCSSTTVYDLCAQGKLAHHRVGVGRGTIRVSDEDLQQYLQDIHVEESAPKETVCHRQPLTLEHLEL